MTRSTSPQPRIAMATPSVPANRPRPGLRDISTLLESVVPRLRLALSGLAVLGLLSLGTSIYMPLLNKRIVDALQFGQRANFHRQMIVLVALVACQLVVGLAYRSASALFNEAVHAGLRRRVVEAVLEKPLSFFRKFEVGDLISRMSTDTEALKTYFPSVVLQMGFDLLTLAVVAFILLSMNVKLALITLGSGPVSIFVGALFQGPVQTSSHTLRARLGAVMSQMQSWISRPLAVKASLLEPVVRAAFGAKNETLRSASFRVQLIEAVATVIATTILAIPTLCVFVLGGTMVFSGDLTIGALVAFTAYAGYFQMPLQRAITVFVATLPALAANYDRLREIIGVAPEPATPVRQIGPVAGLSAVDVRIELGERAGSVDVSKLTVARGEVVGLVGPNGCGKTSLLSALLGFRSISSGRVALKLEDGRSEPLHRGLCSFLPQDSVILDGTLRANIVGFEAVPNEQRLMEIIGAIGMSGWIQSLPQGLDTVVDAGTLGHYSGGQVQQIALARAFYRRDPVLTLDEPGTSLDEVALERIAQLIRAQRDRIVIVISHRQEILRGCDRIYEFRPSPLTDGRSFEIHDVSLPGLAAVSQEAMPPSPSPAPVPGYLRD